MESSWKNNKTYLAWLIQASEEYRQQRPPVNLGKASTIRKAWEGEFRKEITRIERAIEADEKYNRFIATL